MNTSHLHTNNSILRVTSSSLRRHFKVLLNTILVLCSTQLLAQSTEIDIRFADARYDATNDRILIAAEARYADAGYRIDGLNMRWFYNSSELTFTGYVNHVGNSFSHSSATNGGPTSGADLFGFPTGSQLVWVNDVAQPQLEMVAGTWTRLFDLAFTSVGSTDPADYCAAVIWSKKDDGSGSNVFSTSQGTTITMDDWPTIVANGQQATVPATSFGVDEFPTHLNWSTSETGAGSLGNPIDPGTDCTGNATPTCSGTGTVGGTGDDDDFDGDGVCNLIDLDDDNDGVLDSEECPTGGPPIIDLMLVMDGSNSINFDPFDDYIDYTATAIENSSIVPQDGTVRLTVVLFATTTTVVVSPTIINTTNIASIATNIRSMTFPNGGTNTHLGINAAVAAINGISPASQTQILNVITDGQSDDPSGTTAARTAALAAGIDEINVLGFGNRISAPELDALVHPQPNGGAHGYVTTATNVTDYEAVFAQNLEAIVSTNNVVDTDGDGIPNCFDLDSDDDGCSDAFEAGVISTELADITIAPFDNTNVGANGFENSIETATESGAYNGTYTYTAATDDQVNNCSQPCTDPDLYADNCDFDGDGVLNKDDLDADNDGILDELECMAIAQPTQPLDILIVTTNENWSDSRTNLYSEFSTANLPTGSTITTMTNGDSTAIRPNQYEGYNMVIILTVFQEFSQVHWDAIEGAVLNQTSESFLFFTDFCAPCAANSKTNTIALLNNVWNDNYTLGAENSNNTLLTLDLGSNYADNFIVADSISVHAYTGLDNVADEHILYRNPNQTSQAASLMRALPGGDCKNYLFFFADANPFHVARYPDNAGRFVNSFSAANEACTDENTPCISSNGTGDPNRFNLDSDGDGCSDAFEAGLTTDTSPNFQFPATDVGNNGFRDVLETAPESGIFDGTYLLDPVRNTELNACPQPCTDPDLYADNCDFDGDGVNNGEDLDDDNDGILDGVEGCIPFTVIEDFENPTNVVNSGYDNFASAFPAGTSRLTNSNGTYGYLVGPTPTVTAGGATNSFLTAQDGTGYSGGHSSGAGQKEVILVNLDSNGELRKDGNYDFRFLAYQMRLVSLGNDGTTGANINPGYFDIWGIRKGVNPTLNTTTQADAPTISAITGVDLLGTSDLVDNTTEWEEYLISFTAAFDYDRLLISPRSLVPGSFGNVAFLAFDRLAYQNTPALCFDDDNDGIDNHFDLDSDGDGCSDAYEAGVTTSTTTDFQFANTGQGDNGFEDTKETAAESGTYNAIYTYSVATSAGQNQCLDNDMDGVPDYADLDDDNDGILDTVEECNTSLATYPNPTNELQNAIPTGWTAFGNNGSTDFDDGDASSVISNGALNFPQTLTSLFPGSDASDFWLTGAYAPGNTGWLAPKFEANYTTLNNLVVGEEYQVIFDGTFTKVVESSSLATHGAFYLYLDFTSAGTPPAEADKTAPIAINSLANTTTLKFTATSTTHNILIGYYSTDNSGNIANHDIRSLIWFESFKVIATTCVDTDQDGIPNIFDLDSDGDGCPDALEASVTPTANLANGDVVNGDGTTNTTTATDDANFVFTSPTNDTDGDGVYDGAVAVGADYTTNALDANVQGGNCINCDAGTASPTLSANILENICDAPLADLASITASNMPSGTILLEWHTSSSATDATTLYASPTAAVAGTYYGIFHDTANDCYSPVSAELIVTIVDCCAAPSTPPSIVLPSGNN